ncbi:MAG: hypothetical protein KC646_15830 [Candidatus Cloacimonetes bacterium]|nr:hypothetical protein [Candidatus Cloacimonadota bacterium]
MEKSRATIKRSSDKKLSPAQAQKEREQKLSVDVSNFLGPKSEDSNYQVPIMSEDEFKKLCDIPKLKSSQHQGQLHLVKSFLTSTQLQVLQKLTTKLNHNKEKDDYIDSGDFLTLIFEIIIDSDTLGGKLTEKQLIDKLKSIM